MIGRDELAREVDVLGECIATLSAAVLRLGSSLDLATVLQEAADSARKLTHARYSLIVTVARRRSSSPPGGGASAQAGEHRKMLSGGTCPAWSPPLPRYAVGLRLRDRAPLLERVVARAGGDGRRTLDVRQRELRQ